MTDGELVRRTLAGDRSAYVDLVRRWSAPVVAFCHSRLWCSHTADDLAQESLMRALRALDTLDDPDKFGPWLRGIAHRVCLDWLKAKQSSQVPFAALSEHSSPDALLQTDPELVERQVEQIDETERLLAEVESLPGELRETLMLYYYRDVTYRELADLLGVSAAAVNARLTKARALLRERLSGVRRT